MNEKKNKSASNKFPQPEETIDEGDRKQLDNLVAKDNQQPQSVKLAERPNRVILDDSLPLKNTTQKKK